MIITRTHPIIQPDVLSETKIEAICIITRQNEGPSSCNAIALSKDDDGWVLIDAEH